MDVYGLTGGIGSGKSTVANLLEDYGVPVVSADELSRIVVSPGSEGLAEVVAEFGKGVLDEHGGLARAKLAAVVFADPDRRRRLEEILHPRIRERYEQVLDAMEKAGHEVAIYEVPLLFEKNLQGEMKATLLVTAPEAIRVRRVCARDDITETEVRARIAAQMPEALKRRRADYIIENDGNLDALRREVEFLLARFLRVSGVARRGPASQEVVASPSEVDDGPSLPHSLPHALPKVPSRARTEIPTRAPIRTGQTLPPGMSDALPPAAVHADPNPDVTLPAAAIVDDGAAQPITVKPTGSGPIAVPPALSEPIVIPQAPVPADVGPPAPPPSASPSSPVTEVPSSTSTQPPTPTAPAPAEAATQALSTPPKAPPLRKPTGDPKPKAGPAKAAKPPKRNMTIKAPPLRPPTQPPGTPAKPPPPPPAPAAKPPLAPPTVAPAVPEPPKPPKPPPPAPRTKTLVTAPTPPPLPAPAPTPPRGQTERVAAVSPQSPPVDEDAT